MHVYVIADRGETAEVYKPAIRRTLKQVKDAINEAPPVFRASYEAHLYDVRVTADLFLDALNGEVDAGYIRRAWGAPLRRWRGSTRGALRALQQEGLG